MKKFESVNALQSWLDAAGIDTSSWGKGNAKTVEHLWAESVEGDIIIQDDPPLRLVNVVQILIRKGQRRLIEAEQELGNGQRRFRDRLPSEKMKPGEDHAAAAKRCLREELGIDEENVTLLPATHEPAQTISDSPSYPGLLTKYTFHTVEAQVQGLPRADFWRENLAYGEGDPVKRQLWIWRTEGDLTDFSR